MVEGSEQPAAQGDTPPDLEATEDSSASKGEIGSKAPRRTRKKPNAKKGVRKAAVVSASAAKFPRHPVEKALRIPRAIIDQNAGKECTDQEAAVFAGVGFSGPYRVELSSSLKYGFLIRPRPGYVAVTERARQAIRPQKPGDEIEALRQAVMQAPDISEVYKHYRGEYLPDGSFFENALADKFSIPAEKISEFKEIFLASLQSAQLVERKDEKFRVLDASTSSEPPSVQDISEKGRAPPAGSKTSASDSCFVVMPFSAPIGAYYQHIYEPAILKAGLRAVRADADIFGTGKIIDQIWTGINLAKVLVAELTSRNPNVFYELGLAHALKKPVVLVSSNEQDVPFDLKHIRVIYYDVTDPFWGQKLIDKVAENIISAIKNPEEAVFARALEAKR